MFGVVGGATAVLSAPRDEEPSDIIAELVSRGSNASSRCSSSGPAFRRGVVSAGGNDFGFHIQVREPDVDGSCSAVDQTAADLMRSMEVASNTLYVSPQRNQYHKKILDKISMKASASEPVATSPALNRGAASSSESPGVNGVTPSPFDLAVALKYVVPMPRYLFGIFTSLEGVGLEYRVHQHLRRANLAVVVITLLLVGSSIVAMLVDSLATIHRDHGDQLQMVEYCTVAWLLLDFCVRLLFTPRSFVEFWSDPVAVVDFIAILPPFVELIAPSLTAIHVVRVFRLLRLTRLLRNSKSSGIIELLRAMGSSLKALSLLLYILLIALALSSCVIFILDSSAAQFDSVNNVWIRDDGTLSPFQSIYHALWLSAVTLSTVGYGESVPYANAAKFATAALMLCGVLVIAFPTVILSASFHDAYNERFLTLLRSSLTEKHRESFAIARNRKALASLSKKHTLPLGSGASSRTEGGRSSFRSRLESIVRRHSSLTEEEGGLLADLGETAAGRRADNDGNGGAAPLGATTSAAQQQHGGGGVSSTPLPRTDSDSRLAQSRKRSGLWSRIRSIAHNDTPVSDALAPAMASSADQQQPSLPSQSAPAFATPPAQSSAAELERLKQHDPNSVVESLDQTATGTQQPAATAEQPPNIGFTTILDLEKRFAPPDMQPVRLSYVPFSDEGIAASVQEEDSAGFVQTAKLSRHRKSTITDPVACSSDTALRDRRTSGSRGARGGSRTFEGVRITADLTATSFASSDGSEELSSDGEVSDCLEPRRPSALSTSGEMQVKRAPTVVMASVSRSKSRSIRGEAKVVQNIGTCVEALNFNVQQLKSQIISVDGVVHFPPKLKLACVGGTNTIALKVERCFPPGSHSVTFTVLLDSPEYRNLQIHLAKLTFGAGHIRVVEMAPIYKLSVELSLNVRHLRNLSVGHVPKADLDNVDLLLSRYVSESDRALLDSCFITTSTFRHVQSSSVDVVVMCPCKESLGVFQRCLPLLKFSFKTQFRSPHTGLVNIVATEQVHLETIRQAHPNLSSGVAAQQFRSSLHDEVAESSPNPLLSTKRFDSNLAM